MDLSGVGLYFVAVSTRCVHTSTDMNDAVNLDYYTKLLVFRGDPFEQELTFVEPNRFQQGVLHSLPRQLSLEYENSRATTIATISRSIHQDASLVATMGAKMPIEGLAALGVVSLSEIRGEPTEQTFADESTMISEDIFSGLDTNEGSPNNCVHSLESEAVTTTIIGDAATAIKYAPVQHPSLVGYSFPHFGYHPPMPTSSSQDDSSKFLDEPFHTICSSLGSANNSLRDGRASPGDLFGTDSYRRQSPSPSSSNGSRASSGRSGRLNPIVAIAQKAVRAAGACWRCKILRSSVCIKVLAALYSRVGIEPT